MKKTLLFLLGIVAAIASFVAIVVYRWTFTPFGRLHPVMAVMLKLLQGYSLDRIFDTTDRESARRWVAFIKPRIPIAGVENRRIQGPHGPIPIRIYTPEGVGPFPIVVFYHGGGFVIGSIDSHENICRQIARDGSVIVVSVDYRLAPEHPYPVPVDDAYAAFQWVAQNAATFNGDPQHLAVAGDSAGGNLAAVVALKARDEAGPAIGLQILLYAVTTLMEEEFESRRNFTGYILTEHMGRTLRHAYVPDDADCCEPYASPLQAEDLRGLPAAYIMTAEFDPLRDEGKRYADRLREAGVPVTYRCYPGMLHGFLSFADVLAMAPGGERLLPVTGRVYDEIALAIQQQL